MAAMTTTQETTDVAFDPMEALNDRLLLKVERVAQALDLSRSQVAEMIATGELPSIKIGRSRRVPVAALRQWIAEQAAGQGA